MPPLEDDEKVKLEPEKTIAERAKLSPRKRENEGSISKALTPKKLLTWLPTLLAQIKTGNSSNKIKNEIREIVHLLYQHNKITKNVYNNFIRSL